MATISTHNGSTVRTAHNLRAKSCVDREPHIRKDGVHEVWHHEPIRLAYDRLFGKSVRAYNARQKRNDRIINDYLKTVRENSRLHDCYEMIIGVYGTDAGTDEQRRTILKEFVDKWTERNPNLAMIGAYYHADEQGEGPHVHIDYVPVATGYDTGMKTRTALRRALEQQNFFTKNSKETAQIAWEASENAALEKICTAHGISVEHPQAGKGVQHLQKQAYAAFQKLQEVEHQIEIRQAQADQLPGTVADLLEPQRYGLLPSKKIVITKAQRDELLSAAEEIKKGVTVIHDRNHAIDEELATMVKERKRAEKDRAHIDKLRSSLESEIQSRAEELAQATIASYKAVQDTQAAFEESLRLREAAIKKREKELYEREQGIPNIIRSTAERMLQTVIDDVGTSDDRTQRLEEFCSGLTFEDGTTVLDHFESLEQARVDKLQQRMLESDYDIEWEL